MIDLSNKVAVITGGSRGIGSACVEYFVKSNCQVAFTFKTAKNAADEIENRMNGMAKGYQVDMVSELEINNFITQVERDFCKIDILVHNAGIWNDGSLETMTLGRWNELIQVNLTSTFLLCKACAPLMKKNNFGRIILITSTAAQRGEAFHSHYAASKGGMVSFTKSLAVELAGFNITVNSVAPGWVETEMNSEVFSNLNYKKEIEKSIPVGRIASAEDIAGPTLFLASELARHINGEILNVNGGSVLCG